MTEKGDLQTEVSRAEAWFTQRLAEIEREAEARRGGLRVALSNEAKKVAEWHQEQKNLLGRVFRESVADAKCEHGALKAELNRNHKAALQSLEDHQKSKLAELRLEQKSKLAPLEGTLDAELNIVDIWVNKETLEAEAKRQEKLDAIAAKGLAEQAKPEKQDT